MDHRDEYPEDVGRRLLSLDGSAEIGTTELSILIILQELMQRIEHATKLGRMALPWQYFDLIGGSGMGGVFALMLAAWRLSIEETIEAYLTLHKKVFTSEAWSNRDVDISTQLFTSVFREIATSLGKDLDEGLVRSSADACKGFVCTTNAINMKHPRLFRTYEARAHRSPPCTLTEAVIASVAGPPHMQSIVLGKPPEQFISASHRIGNPSLEVLREAQNVFGSSQHVACIVSIGVGQREPLALPLNGTIRYSLLERIVRDTETLDQELEERFGGMRDLFFRLNVMHGLEKITCSSESLSTVTTHTWQYAAMEAVNRKLDALVENLQKRSCKVTLGQMNSVVGPNAQNFAPRIRLPTELSHHPNVDGLSSIYSEGRTVGRRSDPILPSSGSGAGQSSAHLIPKAADQKEYPQGCNPQGVTRSEPYNSGHANQLITDSMTLRENGHIKEALTSSQDAVDIYRLIAVSPLSGLQEAEKKEAASIELQGALVEQDKHIEQCRAVVVADLADTESAVLDAQSAVSNIKRQHLQEVRSMANPPEAVKHAMESVCTLLGHKIDSWRTVQGIIRKDDFITRIVNFDTTTQMTKHQRDIMKTDYLSRPAYNFETVNRASRACGPLVKWVIAQVRFSEILDLRQSTPA